MRGPTCATGCREAPRAWGTAALHQVLSLCHGPTASPHVQGAKLWLPGELSAALKPKEPLDSRVLPGGATNATQGLSFVGEGKYDQQGKNTVFFPHSRLTASLHFPQI